MKNLIYLFPILLMMGCSDTNESQSKKGKWSQSDMDKCVSQMQESAGKFDWDEVGVDFDTKKWATCVCKKGEKEWESFDILDRKEKDAELKKEKEKKMREIFESCREDNFAKKEYSEKQRKKLERETLITKEQVNKFINITKEIDNTDDNDFVNNYINYADLTNESGVSIKYLDSTPIRVYLNNKLFTGLSYREYPTEKWGHCPGWGYYDNREDPLGCTTWRLTNFKNGKKNGLQVLIAENIYDKNIVNIDGRNHYKYPLTILHFRNFQNGKKHGSANLYDSRGNVTSHELYINDKMFSCSGHCDD